MRKRISNIILVFVILLGLSLILYPTISDWWNESRTSRVVSSYQDSVQSIDSEKAEEMFREAQEYNEKLAACKEQFSDYKYLSGYQEALNITDGVMGYISIPVIQVDYPIYHGTSDDVLNVATGHVEGSSLPIGGPNTHCVISAHRGLPSAKLFSDLDRMEVGDVFTLNILDEVMTYQVEKIIIIRPEELDNLKIIQGEDYTTLLTCTPYGVNTHRLLVQAKRVKTEADANPRCIRSDGRRVEKLVVTAFTAIPLLLILFIYWWLLAIWGKSESNKYWYIPYKRVDNWDDRRKYREY